LYARIKDMRLSKVYKKNNEIGIIFDTRLEGNNLSMKRARLTFTFVDGVSESRKVNDFFVNLCRYIKDN